LATTADVAAALASRETAFAGETAQAHGLTLWRVPIGPPCGPERQNRQSEQIAEQDRRQQ
jgi:hypothetical protein